ncbi:MAG TPA: ankyrin repeat domain-containing protein [Methylomirabilota bacterium]|jgi:type II secretory pathway predicted ATPase ExeA
MSHPPLGLPQHGFGDTADPDTFYPSPIHESARADIFAAVKTLAGFVVLTGEPGTGKTTVLRRVTRDVEAAGGRVLSGSAAALLHATPASPTGEADSPGAAAPEARREALLASLAAQSPQGGPIVVAIDEAQSLGRSELEGLRSLVEAGTASGTRLALLLVGQPEIDEKLARLGGQRGAPVHALRVALARLDAPEVGAYVAYRLRLAGAPRNDVFEPDAIRRVAGYAEGIPRVINQLCDAALRIAAQAGVARVSASIVDAAAGQHALPYPARSAVPSLRPASRRALPRTARRAGPGHAMARAWLARAGVAVLVLAAVVLIAPRRTSPPPPPAREVAPVQVEAPLQPPVTPDPDVTTPAQIEPLPPPVARAPEKTMPAQTVRVTPPPTRPTAPGSSLGAPSGRPPSPVTEPRPPREPRSVRLDPARAGARGVASSPEASRPPAPSVTRRASPMALALLDSTEAGNLTEVRALLAAGVSPDARDKTGMAPLMVAVVNDHGAVAEVLLARGADVNAADDGGVTAVMLAANNGRTALLQRLINRGAAVNARTAAGWTALTYAAWNGHAAVVRRLLEAGANPALTDRIGWTALQYAAWRAADGSRTRLPDAADSLPPGDPERAETGQGRYTEVITLLGGAARKR